MDSVRKLLIVGNIFLALVLVRVGISLWPRFFPPKEQPKRVEWSPQFDWVDKKKGMQVISFYASPNTIREGDHISLCYGVAQAKAVAISGMPPKDVWPDYSRCLDVVPRRTTTYTLTATDATGRELQQQTSVRVLAGR